jgi:phosphatidate cytidylyltransferase
VPAACGAAALFWVLVAPPWVIARWPTQRPLAMLLLGWIVLVGAWVALVDLQARSPWLVLAAMAIVWIADTAAYFSGRAFGRRKLAPLVSPGKTWEGVYGAWVAVALYALVLVPYASTAGFRMPMSAPVMAAWVVFAMGLASVSVIGDLFESLLKRHAGVKDSGTLLPGHGGILDRIDALLAAMPIAALAAQAFLARPA